MLWHEYSIMVWEARKNSWTPTWKTFVETRNVKQNKATLGSTSENTRIDDGITVGAAYWRELKAVFVLDVSGFFLNLYKHITAGVFSELHIIAAHSALAFSIDPFFLLLSQKDLEYWSKRTSEWKYRSQDSRTIKTGRKGGGKWQDLSNHQSMVTFITEPDLSAFHLPMSCLIFGNMLTEKRIKSRH